MKTRPVIESVVITTVTREYQALVRQEAETGIMYSGLCGTRVEAHDMLSVERLLQNIADRACEIQHVRCLVLDYAVHLDARIYDIGIGPGEHCVLPGCRAQWRLLSRQGLATVGLLPARWIIRPMGAAHARVIQQKVAAVALAQDKARAAEEALNEMTNGNPVNLPEFAARPAPARKAK